jgi:hypothetical protein
MNNEKVLCKTCPAKLTFHMKIDTGVRKAVALRLRMMLELEMRDLLESRGNFWLQKTLTATQKKQMERNYRKRINALRVVITMCEYGGELPSMYTVIPIQKEGPG